MKQFLVILLSVITFNSYSQDGLCAWVTTDSTDALISIFNSDSFCREDICRYMYNRIVDENLVERPYQIILEGDIVVMGEVFISRGDKSIVYDFYVDKILYSNGKTYVSERFEKPKINNKY